MNNSDVDSYLHDGDDYDAGLVDAMIQQGNPGKRPPTGKGRTNSWRSVENYLEDRKLRQSLKEYYDDL